MLEMETKTVTFKNVNNSDGNLKLKISLILLNGYLDVCVYVLVQSLFDKCQMQKGFNLCKLYIFMQIKWVFIIAETIILALSEKPGMHEKWKIRSDVSFCKQIRKYSRFFLGQKRIQKTADTLTCQGMSAEPIVLLSVGQEEIFTPDKIR